MITFYVTKAGKSFAVGKSKNDSFLTVGVHADNDIVITGIRAAKRFLMVKIQTGILKVSCIGSIRGLKVNKSSLSAGQDKLVPGSGKVPITFEDFALYLKIGEPNADWPQENDIKRSREVLRTDKTDDRSKPKPSPAVYKSSSYESDFFSATDKTPNGAISKPKAGELEETQKPDTPAKPEKKIDALFGDDIDDEIDFSSISGRSGSKSEKRAESSVEEKQVKEETSYAPEVEDKEEDSFIGLFDADDDDDDISVNLSKDEEPEEPPTEIVGATPVEIEDDDDYEDMEPTEFAEVAEEVEEVAEVEAVADVEEAVEVAEVAEVTVEAVEDVEIVPEEFSKAQTKLIRKKAKKSNDIIMEVAAEPEEPVASEPVAVPDEIPTPEPVAVRKDEHKAMKMAVPAVRQPAAQAPAPEKPVQKVVKTIERKTTVRYYEQMIINKNFPLLVVFSKEEIEKIVQQDVAQIEGKEKVKVREDKPVVNVVPQFPGCICVPERQEVDLTPDNTDVKFWITPVAEGKLPAASVNIHYEGKIIQKIECPTKVAKPTAAKVTAGAAIISPIFFSAIESVGLDPKSQMETGFPIVKQISNWLEKQVTTTTGEPFISGMTLLGLIIGFISLIVAMIFFIRSRPKESDPIGDFLNFNFTKNLE